MKPKLTTAPTQPAMLRCIQARAIEFVYVHEDGRGLRGYAGDELSYVDMLRGRLTVEKHMSTAPLGHSQCSSSTRARTLRYGWLCSDGAGRLTDMAWM